MKKRDILVILFIFISVGSIIIMKPLGALDEIWNYNTARAISDGLTPYKDISMITTPILPMITATFLKVIANELIVSRILAACIWTGIIYFVFKVLEELTKEENISLIFTILIGLLCRDIFCIDYNVVVLLISLIILYKELKEKCNDYFIGILAGLAICTKQSIGVTLSVVVVGLNLLFIEDKQQLKETCKRTLRRIIGILIPVGLVFLYLIFTGAIQDFVSYAILGISTFSNKIPYIYLFENDKIEIQILSRLMPISIIVMGIILIITKIIKKENEEIKRILKLLIYSLSIIIVIYPISDEIHFLIGSLISVIGLIYIIYLFGKIIYSKINFKKKKLIYKISTLIIWIVLFAVVLIKSIDNIKTYSLEEKNTEIKHYSNIVINKNLVDRINNMDTYIIEKEKEGKKVYILDAEAAIYMIPIDRYNKDYDMFLKGNLGKNSEQGQIERIKNRKENELYLIRRKDIGNNWQAPLEVISYIRNNLEEIGKIEIFEIYE